LCIGGLFHTDDAGLVKWQLTTGSRSKREGR
jgi:hypothetical protein